MIPATRTIFMPLIYVNGHPGTGKSTACKKLQKLGYKAFDIDRNNLATWRNKRTGRQARMPEKSSERTVKWYFEHGYMISRDKLEELSKEAKSQDIFVFGHSKEDGSIIDLFDKIIFLTLDKQTLIKRLQKRKRGFGAESDELKLILRWHNELEQKRKKQGAVMIDANQPADDVIENILSA